jgi:hypothetical protein
LATTFGDDSVTEKSSDVLHMVRFNFGLSFYKHDEFLNQLMEWQQVEKDFLCVFN